MNERSTKYVEQSIGSNGEKCVSKEKPASLPYLIIKEHSSLYIKTFNTVKACLIVNQIFVEESF